MDGVDRDGGAVWNGRNYNATILVGGGLSYWGSTKRRGKNGIYLYVIVRCVNEFVRSFGNKIVIIVYLALRCRFSLILACGEVCCARCEEDFFNNFF